MKHTGAANRFMDRSQSVTAAALCEIGWLSLALRPAISGAMTALSIMDSIRCKRMVSTECVSLNGTTHGWKTYWPACGERMNGEFGLFRRYNKPNMEEG